VLRRFLPLSILVCLASATVGGEQRSAPSGDLKIVVIAGEGAVNIIQQRTAVAPIVEVRDRNNLPVSGASVTFSVGGSGATFGSGSTLTVVTNAAGQATAAGLTPTTAGAVQINVTASFQGQLATAAVTQTNFATAQAAAAAGSGAAGGGGGASGAGAGAGAAGAGGGISMTTIGIIGGAVAGGVVVATQTDLLGGAAEGGIVLKGQVFANAVFGAPASACPSGIYEASGGGSTCYLNPLSGATVSTTLDGHTATTDTAGNFDLETTVPWSEIDTCKTYTLTIAAAGHPTYVITTGGFSGNESGASSVSRQKFVMSPMTPSFMGGC
jgi:hypothetical protein